MFTSETNASVVTCSNKNQEKLTNSIILENIVKFCLCLALLN